MTTEGNNCGGVSLCKEIKCLENSNIFIIRMDTSEVRKGRDTGEICFVEDEDVARYTTEKLADEEVRRLSTPTCRVFKENMIKAEPYKKRIDIHKQEIGLLYDGTIQKIATVGYVEVPFATFTDPLLSRKDD